MSNLKLFDTSFNRLLHPQREGTLSDHPDDTGGLTMYGISQKAYPREDILKVTRERAKFLYFRDYWGPAGCERVPHDVAFHLFDLAVNAGVVTAIQMLQRAAQVEDDGMFGPMTEKAVRSTDPQRLVARLTAERLEHMTSLKGWSVFGRGWARRIALNLSEA